MVVNLRARRQLSALHAAETRLMSGEKARRLNSFMVIWRDSFYLQCQRLLRRHGEDELFVAMAKECLQEILGL